jgi:hypothetical protein
MALSLSFKVCSFVFVCVHGTLSFSLSLCVYLCMCAFITATPAAALTAVEEEA